MLATSKLRLLRRALPAYMSSMKEGSVQRQSPTSIPAASAASIPAAAAATTATASSSAGEEAMGETIAAKKEHIAWKVLKGLLYMASTAAVGGCAYVSYAYSVDDVEKYMASLRTSKNLHAADDFDLIQKMRRSIYSASVSATIKVSDYYLDVRKSIEDQVRGISAPSSNKLLPDLQPQEQHVFTLVLDLNETLVFSDWKRDRGWRTFKRPGVEPFLEQLAQYYELVIYSDQLSFYVDPVLERLDTKGCIRYRLSRDATQYIDGKHMRDLSKLNRDPARVIYLSGHALESTLNPENALPIKAWKLEGEDTSLLDLLPFLEYVARNRPADIRTVLASYQGQDIASEFRVRHQEYQRIINTLGVGGAKGWDLEKLPLYNPSSEFLSGDSAVLRKETFGYEKFRLSTERLMDYLTMDECKSVNNKVASGEDLPSIDLADRSVDFLARDFRTQ